MKKLSQITCLIMVLLFASCKKTITPSQPPSPGAAACKLKIESTNLGGNYDSYEYSYNKDGRISLIKKFVGGSYHVLTDSTLIGDHTVVSHPGLDDNWLKLVGTTVYEGSMFDALPAKAHVAREERGVTQTDIFTYFFFYDNKNRLKTVGEQTDHVIGDWEYDLNIFYDDHDNVTALQYLWTTGPRDEVTTITATGYDDKPTPFAGIKSWPFFMHAAWNNYDPEPLLTALSKNNPLGYTTADGFKREMKYTYNEQGFPVKRMNTNTNASGSYSFEEDFTYECQ
jgi:YD repeat-containing protein